MLDLTKKENQTFKNWFKIMWGNSYIQIFGVALIAVIIQLLKLDSMIYVVIENFSYSNSGGLMTLVAMFLPTILLMVIIYKGFYQFWNDLKTGNSR